MKMKQIKELLSIFPDDIVNPKTDEAEIFSDIISLLHCFAMKMYSQRRKNKLRIVKEDL